MLDIGTALVKFHGNSIASQAVVPYLDQVLSMPPPSLKTPSNSVRNSNAKDLELYDLLQEGAEYSDFDASFFFVLFSSHNLSSLRKAL
jgi:hypothetical protein